MKSLRALLLAGACVFSSPALADYLFTAGSGNTAFDFTCFSTKHCFAGVNINSAGTEIMTAANPGQVTGANGTFPVTGTITANQGGAWSVTLNTGANSIGSVTQGGAPWTVNPGTIGTWGLAASTQNVATPTNGVLVQGEFNTTPTVITPGNSSPLQLDTNGNLLTDMKAMAGTVLGSGCAGALNGFSNTIPATVCGVFGTYVLNATTPGAAAPATSSPVTPSNLAIGAATLATTQVSVGTTATTILAARTGVAGTGRVSASICNTGTTAVWLGAAGVTTATGQLLAGIVGACATFNTTAAIVGIVGSGTQTVAASETF